LEVTGPTLVVCGGFGFVVGRIQGTNSGGNAMAFGFYWASLFPLVANFSGNAILKCHHDWKPGAYTQVPRIEM
jgi:hypothetical protein